MALSRATLRVAGNAASALGQHDAGARIPAQVGRRSTPILIQWRARACSSPAELRELGDLRGADAELTRRWNHVESRWCAPTRSRNAPGCGWRRRESRSAIADLRAADQQYVALGLEFNRIDTNTALSQRAARGE